MKGTLIIMKKIRKLKKALALVLFCAMLTVSVLSVGVRAATDYPITSGPYQTAERYGSQMMYYKYTTAIDASTIINRTLDGKNYIKKIAYNNTSMYAKGVGTYACIYSGVTQTSKFNNQFFYYPATNTTLNKGLIVVSAAACYTSGGTAIESEKETEDSKNSASVEPGMITTLDALTSFGTIEYRNNVDTLSAYLSTFDF